MEAELVHHLLDDHRDLAHVRPRVPLARVEVDQQVVRPLDVVDPRVPRVQLDAAEVRDPREPGGVRDDGEVRVPPARKVDPERVQPVRMRLRNALLVEEKPVHAVRVALHLHRPAAHVVEHAGRDVDVVLDQVALRQPGLREEDLVQVGEADVAAADAHAAFFIR